MHRTRLVQHQVTSGFINVVAENHYLPAFWAHPEIGGTFPALVLIHTWLGLTGQMRRQVRRFAELGFYVIAPDLFEGEVAQDDEQGRALQAKLGEAAIAKVSAALSALETHNRVNRRVGILGWQMGGELALNAAVHRTDLQGAVIFSGKPDQFLTLIPASETPILAFYAEKDSSASPEMIEQLRSALAKSAHKGEVVVLAGTTEGFFNDESQAYNEQAATQAWEKLLDFLVVKMKLDVSKRHTQLD